MPIACLTSFEDCCNDSGCARNNTWRRRDLVLACLDSRGAGALMGNHSEKLASRFANNWHFLCYGVPSIRYHVANFFKKEAKLAALSLTSPLRFSFFDISTTTSTASTRYNNSTRSSISYMSLSDIVSSFNLSSTSLSSSLAINLLEKKKGRKKRGQNFILDIMDGYFIVSYVTKIEISVSGGVLSCHQSRQLLILDF